MFFCRRKYIAVPLGLVGVSTLYLEVQLFEDDYLSSLLRRAWHARAAPGVTASTANPCRSSYAFPVEHTQTIWAETSAWQYLGNSSVYGTKQSSATGLPHGRSPSICSRLASEIRFGLVGEFLKMKLRQLGQWFRQMINEHWSSYSCSVQLFHYPNYGIKKKTTFICCFTAHAQN